MKADKRKVEYSWNYHYEMDMWNFSERKKKET